MWNTTTLTKWRIKMCIIISVDVEKTFGKIQHSFKIKTLNKICIEEIYPNITKVISNKLMVKIILNCEKLKAFSLRSGERQEWPLLFKAALQFLPGEVWQEKEIKDIQIGMKKTKLSLFTNDILDIENP